jgi:hypothetical protein
MDGSITVDFGRAVFLGTKGVDVTKLSEKLDPLYIAPSMADTFEPPTEVDLDEFLKNERMNAMCSIVETTSTNVRERGWFYGFIIKLVGYLRTWVGGV